MSFVQFEKTISIFIRPLFFSFQNNIVSSFLLDWVMLRFPFIILEFYALYIDHFHSISPNSSQTYPIQLLKKEEKEIYK